MLTVVACLCTRTVGISSTVICLPFICENYADECADVTGAPVVAYVFNR